MRMNAQPVLSQKSLRLVVAAEYVMMITLILAVCCFINFDASAYVEPVNGVIVIDAGHGGIDGGANRDGILEKDINLTLALKLKTLLEQRGFKVILTREQDISLDHLNQSSGSRHKRDLIARTDIINAGNAQIFLSLHVDSMAGDPSENGSVVFYGSKFPQSKALASYIQNELNKISIDGKLREQHGPLPGNYYILSYTDVPGVIIETGFITNEKEREMLTTEEFLHQLAKAIADGAEMYLKTE